MKLIYYTLLLTPFVINAQTKEKSTISLDSIVFDITPSTLAPSEINLPFKKVEVIDARFDTSKIGFKFIRRDFDNDYKDFKKIKLKNGSAKTIEQFYNEYYKAAFNNEDNCLLVVLKRLWLSDMPMRSNKNRRYDIQRKSFQDIHTKVEFYLKKGDNCFPLVRIDSVYQLTDENIASPDITLDKSGETFFIFTLKSLIEKNDFVRLVSKINSVKSYKQYQIDSFNNKRFYLPMLKENKINEGVFMSFDEFVNNKPSITEYKINKAGVIKDTKDSVLNPLYWALYDKKGLHVNETEGLGIWRVGNTFELFLRAYVYLPRTITGKVLSILPLYKNSTITPPSDYKLHYIITPRQIDMETGEIY